MRLEMGLSDRTCLISLLILLICCFANGRVLADEGSILLRLKQKDIITEHDIWQEDHDCKNKKQETSDCKIMRQMYNSIQTVERFYTPNGLVFDHRYFVTEKQMMSTIKINMIDSTKNYKEYCDILSRMPPNMANGDPMSGLVSSEIALMMDQKKGHCLPNVMAAFPKGDKISRYIKEEIEPECKKLKLGYCEAIHRP